MKHKKSALMQSVIALLLCISMLVGTTFAWFTDSVTTGINTIAAGNLDVALYHSNAAVTDEQVDSNTMLFMDLQGDPILWEPGVVSYENLRVSNEGDLALAYQMAIATENENFVQDPSGAAYGLSQILKVGVVEGGITATDRAGVVASVDAANWTTLASFLRSGSLLPEGAGESEKTWGVVIYWEPGVNDNLWNLNNGKQLDQGEYLMIDLGVRLIATQEQYENDSFGSDYDTNAKADIFPDFVGGTASTPVTPNDQNQTAADVSLNAGKVSAIVPAGVQLADGASKLTLSVTEMNGTGANIQLGENEAMRSLDVHIEGVAANNAAPITVTLKEVAPTGLNIGNYKLYHVEGTNTNEMTPIASDADFTAHNQFKYDPATGDIVLNMATFSEVSLVADTVNPWNGTVTTAFAGGTGTEADPYIIANADQLAGFGAMVGGMIGDSKQDFAGKYIKLISDINLGDKDDASTNLFYPIGYYNSTGSYEKTSGGSVTSSVSSFEGTFDGNGHTIENFYQNTWEMFGDYNDGYSGTPNHYKDAMGLFGYVNGGTVKNLTVNNFSSDGEFTPTGVIAAYADGNSTFENIAITNCNPRVYNTGNGGIIGIAGDTSAANDDHITLKNITVDNSNKISALWGSYDVACGGLVGMYRGNVDGSGNATEDTISFKNCHVSAIIDVYNDVCANYQYYAYRYAGMIIGSVRHNTKNAEGKVIPNMKGISANGCTVNYGDWNDYYYCEFEKNTMASYSEDYQFSRVPHSELNFTDSNDNGVVDADERASVTGCKHTHTAEENHQAIYLPFHQLFTGYGWGVNSIGLEKYSGITVKEFGLDIGEGENESSVDKFAVQDNLPEIASGLTVNVGNLFKEKENLEYDIDVANVTVFVSPIGNDSTVAVEYTANTTDWTQGTLTFSGSGSAEVIITDYNFCKETKLTININTADKFRAVFDTDPNTAGVQTPFLYRVGNHNAVKVSSLFAAVNNEVLINSANVEIKIDSVDNSGATGVFTKNTSNWLNGEITFRDTGPVKVTVGGDSGSAVELYLEVVDAINLTSARGTTTGENFVLLCNVSTTNYQYYTNSTLYGNGFTYSLNGAPTDYNSKQGHGVLIASGATFDNVVIIGDVYATYGAYTSQSNYNAAIHATSTTIQNCYVANCATPVRGSDVTIVNSTLYGGTVANLILSSGTNTLKDVTTVNYNDDRNVLGLGIVVNDEAADNTKIVIKGALKQYNYVCESDSSKVPGTEAKALFKSMFSSTFNGFKTNGYVNTGIVIMSESLNTDIITGSVEGYEKLDDATLSLSAMGITKNVNGAVYAPKGSDATVDNNYSFADDNHASDVQGAYLPAFEFDLGNYKDTNDGEDDTRYCYESVNNKEVRLLYQDGQEPFTFDLTTLASVTKFGDSLETTVICKDSAGIVLAENNVVTLEDAGMYTFEITVNDDIIYGADGKLTGESVSRTYVVNVELSVKKASWKNAEIMLSSPSSKSGYNSSKYYVLDFLGAISITDYSENGNSEQVDLKAEYDSYDIVYGNTTSYAWAGFTLTINYKDGRVLTVTFGAPSELSSPGASAGGKTISLKTDTTHGYLLQTDGKINTKVSGTWPITKCTFKGANTVTVEETGTVTISVDKNTTINVTSSGNSEDTCVTGDTLITLADGTQKRIDELDYDDELLVWDFYNGEYTSAPISIIYAHEEMVQPVLHLNFSDGTTVKVISSHGFFDTSANNFVYISEENVAEFIGHKFVKENNGNYAEVTLKSFEVIDELTTAYWVQTAVHNNAVTEGMLSITTPDYEGWFDYFNINDDMKYDEKHMQAEIAKYGLTSYDELSYLGSYETYVALNAQYLNILIGRGVVTMEEILELFEMYV